MNWEKFWCNVDFVQARIQQQFNNLFWPAIRICLLAVLNFKLIQIWRRTSVYVHSKISLSLSINRMHTNKQVGIYIQYLIGTYYKYKLNNNECLRSLFHCPWANSIFKSYYAHSSIMKILFSKELHKFMQNNLANNIRKQIKNCFENVELLVTADRLSIKRNFIGNFIIKYTLNAKFAINHFSDFQLLKK